jgi:ubiquinone/menaquinone biosynthesis C-methylase UbiE
MIAASSARQNPAIGADAVDWATIDLPNAWPDVAYGSGMRHVLRMVAAVLTRRQPVTLPTGLPGAQALPKYLLHEFHHLPNGFYSKNIAAGYARGFDATMLGHMRHARTRVAAALAHCRSVADIGSGSGSLAAAFVKAGIPDVWAVEPSPYLLQIAARRLGGVRVVQGLAENTGFAERQLDGVGLTYVFHELPAGVADAALAEIHRVLRPGGRLAFAEPSSQHYARRPQMFRRGALRALYFHLMAQLAYEPFVEQWHRRDIVPWLTNGGFRILELTDELPTRFVIATRD